MVLIGISLTLLSFLIPVVMWTLEIAVLVFTVRQTLKTANHLKRTRVALASVSKSNLISNKAQIQLEKRIRFWVKVTTFSSITLMISFVLFASRITFRTPQLFLLNMAMLSFGKIGNVLAQVMVAAPPPSSAGRVSVATSLTPSSTTPKFVQQKTRNRGSCQ